MATKSRLKGGCGQDCQARLPNATYFCAEQNLNDALI
jgi:hypothetical protein